MRRSGLVNILLSVHDTFTVCSGGYTIKHSVNVSPLATNENTLLESVWFHLYNRQCFLMPARVAGIAKWTLEEKSGLPVTK